MHLNSVGLFLLYVLFGGDQCLLENLVHFPEFIRCLRRARFGTSTVLGPEETVVS